MLGAYQGVLDPTFPWKNLPYSEILWKTFDLPDPEFSSSSSRRVFCSRLKALFRTVSIEQLLKKIFPWYDRGLPGGYWIQFPWKKSYLCFIRSQQNYLSHITQSINILTIYWIEKLRNNRHCGYSSPFLAISKPTFLIHI